MRYEIEGYFKHTETGEHFKESDLLPTDDPEKLEPVGIVAREKGIGTFFSKPSYTVLGNDGNVEVHDRIVKRRETYKLENLYRHRSTGFVTKESLYGRGKVPNTYEFIGLIAMPRGTAYWHGAECQFLINEGPTGKVKKQST